MKNQIGEMYSQIPKELIDIDLDARLLVERIKKMQGINVSMYIRSNEKTGAVAIIDGKADQIVRTLVTVMYTDENFKDMILSSAVAFLNNVRPDMKEEVIEMLNGQ